MLAGDLPVSAISASLCITTPNHSDERFFKKRAVLKVSRWFCFFFLILNASENTCFYNII